MKHELEILKRVYNVSASVPPTSETKYKTNVHVGVVADNFKQAVGKFEEVFPTATIHSVIVSSQVHIP